MKPSSPQSDGPPVGPPPEELDAPGWGDWIYGTVHSSGEALASGVILGSGIVSNTTSYLGGGLMDIAVKTGDAIGHGADTIASVTTYSAGVFANTTYDAVNTGSQGLLHSLDLLKSVNTSISQYFSSLSESILYAFDTLFSLIWACYILYVIWNRGLRSGVYMMILKELAIIYRSSLMSLMMRMLVSLDWLQDSLRWIITLSVKTLSFYPKTFISTVVLCIIGHGLIMYYMSENEKDTIVSCCFDSFFKFTVGDPCKQTRRCLSKIIISSQFLCCYRDREVSIEETIIKSEPKDHEDDDKNRKLENLLLQQEKRAELLNNRLEKTLSTLEAMINRQNVQSENRVSTTGSSCLDEKETT